MTDDEVAAKIEKLDDLGDPESAHIEADQLICELLESLGFVKTSQAFKEMYKWYA